MDDRVVQFRVGVMVLASLLITGILVVLFGELPRFAKQILRPTYTVRLWFPEGRGLAEDGLVHRNGIAIGRVTDVRFATDEKGREDLKDVSQAEYQSGVLVTAEIQEDVKLYEHDACRIQTDLLGKPSLHFFRPPDRVAAAKPLDASKLRKGAIAADPFDSLSVVTQTFSELTPKIDAASVAMTNAGNAIDEAAGRVSAILDEETQAQVRNAIVRLNESMESMQNMIGDKQTQEDLKAALKELPASLSQIKATMQEAQARMDEVQPLTVKLGSEDTIERLDRATRHLDQVMADLAVFSQTLKDPQGSLGLLLQDRQLYDNLNSAAANIDNLSRRLQPILDDVRVFTDKVSRHPERLGVRGALQRYPGIK